MTEQATGKPQVPPEQVVRAGANWFYWVAGLSLANSLVAHFGSQWGFVVGLGLTQVFDAIGMQAGPAGKAVALVLDVGAAALFVVLGVFARRWRPVYIVGMLLYALDGLLFLVVKDWLGLGFHAFVIVTMLPGLAAFSRLGEAQAAPVTAAAQEPGPPTPPIEAGAPPRPLDPR